jgi:hypothetical protein
MDAVGGDCFGKMEEVIKGLNNICTVVGDIISSMAWMVGYRGARCCGEKSCDDVKHSLD